MVQGRGNCACRRLEYDPCRGKYLARVQNAVTIEELVSAFVCSLVRYLCFQVHWHWKLFFFAEYCNSMFVPNFIPRNTNRKYMWVGRQAFLCVSQPYSEFIMQG